MGIPKNQGIGNRRTTGVRRFLQNNRQLAFELLEDRRLLSFDLLESALAGPTQETSFEAFYWSGGRQIALLPSEDESVARGHSDIACPMSVFVNPETGSRVAVADEIVVALEPGADPEKLFADGLSGYRRLRGTPDQYVVTISAGSGTATLARANKLHGQSGVAWAVPNFYHDFRNAVIPDDPLFGDQWHLHNTGQTAAKVDADADLPEAWDITTGSQDIVIAVLDNGVQTGHPDLNIFENQAEARGSPGQDDDGNGWIDDVHGWDFKDDDNDPNPATDYDNHGTAVAGVAAALGNNGLGVTGAAQNIKVLPVKIARDDTGEGYGYADAATIAEAVYYASGRTADGLGSWRGADILVNSWTGKPGAEDPVLNAAFNWATVNGRDGLGAASFNAAGNAASGYQHYSYEVRPGEWVFEWRYEKDASGSVASETAWLANVRLPDGTVERFDSPELPAGWSTSGDKPWSVVDDPAYAYGTGRDAARAGSIDDNQVTTLRSPTITVDSPGQLRFNAWVSSEQDFDKLNLYASSDGGSTFKGPFFGASGVSMVRADVSYPANLPSTIAVGGSTDWDYRADYSQYGSALDFVAPSSGGFGRIITTDRTGEDGCNALGTEEPVPDPLPDTDYTSVFDGTSASTPLAAGIGALLLSNNPDLTAEQLRLILRDSTDKIGDVSYTNGFNHFYGHGRVNAARALATLGVVVSVTGGSNAVAEGGFSDTYQVVLGSQPSNDVIVRLNLDPAPFPHPEAQVEAVDDANESNAYLEFTPANWNVPQHVRVTAVDDPNVEDFLHLGIIRHTATSDDADFNGVAIPNMTVQVTDNDVALPASVGNWVWRDSGDGIQNDGERGVFGVEVELVFLGKDGVFGAGDDGSIPPQTTDAEGRYNFTDLTPGEYYLQFPTSADFSYSPQDQGDDDALDSDVDPATGRTAVFTLEHSQNDMTLDAGLVYDPALILGQQFHDVDGNGVHDPGEPGLDGWKITLLDQNGQFLTATTTASIDLDGNGQFDPETESGLYLFKDLVPGTYRVELEMRAHWVPSLPAQPTPRYTVTLSSGQVAQDCHFGVYPLPSIGDLVWHDSLDGDGIQDPGEPGLPGVQVELFSPGADGQIGGGDDVLVDDPHNPQITDTEGRYLFEHVLPAAQYYLKFTPPDGFVFSLHDQGTDDALDSDAHFLTGMTEVFTLPIGPDDETRDAAVTDQPASVNSQAFHDLDGNGIQTGDPGVPGAELELFYAGKDGQHDGGDDLFVKTRVSDPSGTYSFADLPPGGYYLQSMVPDGVSFSPPDQGEDDTLDSDFDPISGRTAVFTLGLGQDEVTQDLGLIYRPCTVKGQQFDDVDRDGRHDPGEPALDGWTIRLVHPTGQLLKTTTTSSEDLNGDGQIDPETEMGLYSFEDLPTGTYRVEPEVQTHWVQSVPPCEVSVCSPGELTGPFRPGQLIGIPGASGVKSVFAADLDGDGDQDVLSASSGDDKIAWYKNLDGAGTFGPQLVITTDAEAAQSVFAVDLDGDGDQDVLSASSGDDKIAWYENVDGAGAFGPQQIITTSADGAQSVFPADLDGDGDQDILSASYWDDKIAWYENLDGAGKFGPQRVITTDADGAKAVFAADLDGDGDQDVLSASSSDDKIAWYENLDGAGTFGPQRVITTDADGASAVSAADLDGDGDVDVLCGSETWYENLDGEGTFAPPPVITASFGSIVFAADLDGDGDVDVLSGPGTWWENLDGLGTFRHRPVTGTRYANSAFAADFNGDGDLDVLSASFSGDTVAWFENVIALTLGPRRVIGEQNADSLYAEDLDGDGDQDILSGQQEGPVDWYENVDGAGTFGPPQFAGDFGWSFVAADLDGDGDQDVISGRPEMLTWSENVDGAGWFDGGSIIDTRDAGWGVFDVEVFAADVDGDGDQDVLWASAVEDPIWPMEIDGVIAWYENLDGEGRFGSQQIIADPWHMDFSLFAADLDGDGDQDVLSGQDNVLVWYENRDGAGRFGPERRIATYAYLNRVRSVFAADLDGDGDQDVLAGTDGSIWTHDGQIAWYENLDGEDTFVEHFLTGAGSSPSVAAADLDGDGDQDIVSVSSGAGTHLHENIDAAGNFETRRAPDVGSWMGTPVFAADVHGDGDSDVLSVSGGVIGWCEALSLPGNFDSQRSIALNPTGVSSVFAADLDGDGDQDVLSASPEDHKIAWCENLDHASGFGPQRAITTSAYDARGVVTADVDGDGDQDVLSASAMDDKIAWYENLDAAGAFGPQQVITTDADGANSVFATDLDGDGDEDVLSASSGDDKIAWYENLDGAGTFGPEQVITTDADYAQSVFAADLDGDGDQDVLSASFGDNKIAWYENDLDGAGAFGPQRLITTNANGARCVFAADLDGDGDEDVLSASSGDNKIAWYENDLDGAGAFGPQQLITTNANGARSVFAVDLDGDGDQDVLSASFDDDKIAWYENLDGAGAFGSQQVITTDANGANSVFAADLDGDRDQDVISASDAGSKLAWYENPGAALQRCNCGSYRLPSIGGLVWHDLDYDGIQDPGEPGWVKVHVDLLQQIGGPPLQGTDTREAGYYSFDDLQRGSYYLKFTPPDGFLLGLPNCGSDDALDSDVDPVTGLSDRFFINFGSDDVTCDAALVDQPASFNGRAWHDLWHDAHEPNGIREDGELGVLGVEVHLVYAGMDDVPGGDDDLTMATQLTDPSGTYSFAELLPGRHYLEFLVQSGTSFSPQDEGGDDTRDSDVDPVTGRTEVFTLRPGENDLAQDAGLIYQGSAIRGQEFHDINGDSVHDPGEPGLDGWTIKLLQGSQLLTTVTTSSVDLNNDGQIGPETESGLYCFEDLRPGTYRVEQETQDDWFRSLPGSPRYYVVLPTTGAGTFGPQELITRNARGAQSVFAADLDGDLDLDVLSTSILDDKVAWYENVDGLGTFGPEQVITVSANEIASAWPVDLDRDGDLDVFAAHSRFISWYENIDGSGSFGPSQLIVTADERIRSAVPADLDGDGDLEFLVAHYGSIVWCEVGGPPFVPSITSDVVDCRSVRATDLDGDGDPDVLSASFLDGKIAWYENLDGAGTFGAQQVITTDAEGAQSAIAADLDGDGYQDVLSASWGDDKIAWYENTDGRGTFGPQQVITTNADGAQSVFAADLDGDGDLDVLSASSSDDKIAWYENVDGAGTFGPQQVITTDADGALSVFAADLDGDANVDVLSASSFDDKVAWYEGLKGDALGRDFGSYQWPSVGGLVWKDLDGDGTQDLGEPVLEGVQVELFWIRWGDQIGENDPLIGTVTTDANGHYRFDHLATRSYKYLKFTPTDGFVFTRQDQGGDDALDSDVHPVTGLTDVFRPAIGPDRIYDAGVTNQPGTINGWAWHDLWHDEHEPDGIQDADEPGVLGAVAELVYAGPDNAPGGDDDVSVATQLTDSSGNYSFADLSPGDYYVRFSVPAGPQHTFARWHDPPVLIPPDDPWPRKQEPFVYHSELSVDGVYGTIANVDVQVEIWQDCPSADFEVCLISPSLTRVVLLTGWDWDDLPSFTLTDFDGEDPNGIWTLEVAEPSPDPQGHYSAELYGWSVTLAAESDGVNYSPSDEGGDDSLDSDVDPATRCTPVFTLGIGQTVTQDVGLMYQGASIQGQEFHDINGNRAQDLGEPGLDDRTIQLTKLLHETAQLLTTTTTAVSGLYSFDDLLPGTYRIEQEIQTGWVPTLGGYTITLSAGQTEQGLDFGTYQLRSIGDLVWHDRNGNGIQDRGDPGERGLEGIRVELRLADDDSLLEFTATDTDGHYYFHDLPVADYYLRFFRPDGFVFSPQNQGADDELDSDPNPANGLTDVIHLDTGTDALSWDAGMIGKFPAFGFAVGTGDEGIDEGRAVAADAAGNVLIVGRFMGMVDFDPGPANLSLISAGEDDIFIAKYASSGALLWVRAMGGSGSDAGLGVAVDEHLSVYVTGYFSGTVDFDPGIDTLKLTSAGETDIFVAKLDRYGDFVWARCLGGPGTDAGLTIAVDKSGNVYSAGSFSDTADFDPGPATDLRTSAGDADIFVSKLDGSGTFVWARAVGDSGFDQATAIAVDNVDEVHLTGKFAGTVDFDPGTGRDPRTSAGGSDIFVATFNSSGNLTWVETFGDSDDDLAGGIAVDGAGNRHVTGAFQGTVDFDPGDSVENLTSLGDRDVFVAKFDALGALLWARSVGDTGADEAHGIALDGQNNVYLAGSFEGTDVDFDPGTGIYRLISVGGKDLFVLKLDDTGLFTFAQSAGGESGDEEAFGLAVDMTDEIYITGAFSSIEVDLDPTDGDSLFGNEGNADIIIIEVSPPGSVGDFVWHDLDGDGMEDANEPGFLNVAVKLYGRESNSGEDEWESIETTTTNRYGNYIFMGVEPWDYYRLQFVAPEGYVFTPLEGSEDKGGGPVDSVGETVEFTREEYDEVDAIDYLDAGLYHENEIPWPEVVTTSPPPDDTKAKEAQTTSSVTVQFSQLIDPSVINVIPLSDTKEGVFGPADFTLVGDTVGPVPGSLILNGSQVTFISTGGLLQRDTYTVTLLGEADSFRDFITHEPLDGDGDGRAGGDFSYQFTLDKPPSVVVSLPDFSCAPGQSVDVPTEKTSTGLPIYITVPEAANVTRLLLAVVYDPLLLTINGATPEIPILHPEGFIKSSEPGLPILEIVPRDPLGAGKILIATLAAEVPTNVRYGSAQVLVTSVLINDDVDFPTVGDDAVHVLAYSGDTSGSEAQNRTRQDAELTLRVAIELDEGFFAYPLIDPVLLADLTGNGHISSLDAARILQRSLDVGPPDDPPSGHTYDVDVDDAQGLQGELVTVPVKIDNAEDVESFDLRITYDPDVLSFSAGCLGSLRCSDPGLGDPVFGFHSPEPGVLIVGVAYPDRLPTGGGTVVELDFRIAPTAAFGQTALVTFESEGASLNEQSSNVETSGGRVIVRGVVDRHVFYNHSIFDGNDAGANQQDDQAVAPDKQALLPGQTASFANYTSYSRGINGIMIDIAGLPEGVILDADDFEFRLGNSDAPGTWPLVATDPTVAIRRGAGTDHSDRVTLIWPDNVIQKQWLQVTVLANEHTGLLEADVFYFGNAVGESGNSTTDAKVNAYDMLGARDNQRTFINPAAIDFNYDYNRDKRVNTYDMLIARDNQTHFLNALKLITVPDDGGADSAVLSAPEVYPTTPAAHPQNVAGAARIERASVRDTVLAQAALCKGVENVNSGKDEFGEIHGSKWNDLDGNGIWDASEPGLEGWTICGFLDDDGNGQWDPGEWNDQTTTDAHGDYTFEGLTPGVYTVTEELPDGWEQTCPSAAGPEFQVNTYTAESQQAPSVATDAAGNFVIAWESLRQDGDLYGVYAQRYRADGTPVGEEFQVNTYAADSQASPSVAMDPAGSFVIAWASKGQDGDWWGVYGQRYDKDGNPLSGYNPDGTPTPGEFQINSHTNRTQWNPSVAMDAAGNFVVVWESSEQDGSGYGIYAQVYHADGTPNDTEFQVNTHTASTQINPSIASDATGNFVVAWQSYGPDGDGGGIFAQRFEADGTPVGSEFQANSTTENEQHAPSIAMDAADNFVVAWHSYYQDGSQKGIYSQLYDANGNPNGGEFQVNTYTIRDQWYPSVAMDAAGNFFITWVSEGQDGDGAGIFGQLYLADGTPSGGEFQVNVCGSGYQYAPSVATDQTGNAVVAFKSSDGGGYGVFARQFRAFGSQSYRMILDLGEVVENCDFGNYQPGEIHGSKWHDLDEDGIWEADEPGLEGWTIYLDENQNGQLDSTERCTTTDAGGHYAFTGLAVGTYWVAEELQPDWLRTFPGGGTHSIAINPADIVEDVHFGNFIPPGEIRGSKWHDLDGDGQWDVDEVGLEAWTIYLDENQNGQLDPDERFSTTDAAGNYSFTNLTPDTYTVAEMLPEGWRQTFPESSARLTDSGSWPIGFGCAYDFGFHSVAARQGGEGELTVDLTLYVGWESISCGLLPGLTDCRVAGQEIFVDLYGASPEIVLPVPYEELTTVSIPSLDPGTYFVYATLYEAIGFPPPVFFPTWQAAGTMILQSNRYRIHLESGEIVEEVNFGNHSAQVVGRHIFYNYSGFDGNDPDASQMDDNAIALDPENCTEPWYGKKALLPGQTATFQNYTNYVRGINGIMIDILSLLPDTAPTIDDFQFKVGNSVIGDTNIADVANWEPAPVPTDIALRRGEGVNGSDRVTIIWTDNAIQKQWLQVTVLANEDTGLLEPDVFYFGNAIGESGNSTTDAKVNAYDMLGARDNQRTFVNPAPICFPYDYDRDARVNTYDMLIARDNQTHFLNALKLITVPGSKTASEHTTEVISVFARDVILEQTVMPKTGDRVPLFGKLDWLYEFEQMGTNRRPSRRNNLIEEAFDKLPKVYWP